MGTNTYGVLPAAVVVEVVAPVEVPVVVETPVVAPPPKPQVQKPSKNREDLGTPQDDV